MNRALPLLATMICATIVARAAGTDHLPKRLVAFSGGYWTGLYHVELAGDTLLYWRGGPDDQKSAAHIKPSTEQWREFRQALDSLGIWRWRSDYSTRGIYDATAWIFEVEYSDRSIKTGGDSGIFPDKDGAPVAEDKAGASDQYVRYVRALKRLLGDAKFPQ